MKLGVSDSVLLWMRSATQVQVPMVSEVSTSSTSSRRVGHWQPEWPSGRIMAVGDTELGQAN